MGLNFHLPFLIISNCAQLQKHHPFSFLLLLDDDEVIFYCIIPCLQLNLTMPWHFNRKGGCYHYGHSYPMQKRVQVIATYLATLSTAITAEICQVSYDCVTKYVDLFQQKATLSQIVSNNIRPRKIVWWMEAYLEALVRFYPTIFLRELQEILANDFQLGPHEVTSKAGNGHVIYEAENNAQEMCSRRQRTNVTT